MTQPLSARNRRYVATNKGCSFGTPMGYRVWLFDYDVYASDSEKAWIREVTCADLTHTDAALLAERLNREAEC